ncbi:MAG: cytochrome b/b6 domain-containing protein [Tepidisphaerales bacterium]
MGASRSYAREAVLLMLMLAGPLAAQPVTRPAPGQPAAMQHTTTRPTAQPVSYLTMQTDAENCLSCHRFRGLSRIDPATGALRLFFCNADYYALRTGPHARLRCTACHESREVRVIPHQVKTPVDCTRACHIVPSSGVEILFSHQRMKDSLERSVHATAKLQALKFDQPLLRPGQSVCLFCHNQPSYGGLDDIPRPIGHAEVTSRCDSCHGEQMPADTSYYAHHVTTRLAPAQPIRQLAETCAVCHSDPKIIPQIGSHGSHDTIASYLHSFHGKAKMLGSRQTAACLDCHASQEGDVHLMRPKSDPASSINQARLPTTCRTSQCHTGAPPGMSQAAVHLNLDLHARSLEFYLAAMFVALTAGTLAVFFILIILDLFNTVVRPHDREHERLVALARKLQDTPAARGRLTRMSPFQRVQHWLLAVTFILLSATGMPIKFADEPWAAWLMTVFHGLPIARLIHRVCGVLLIAVFVFHLVYIMFAFIKRVRTARATGDREPIWRMALNSPMMMTPRDAIQFFQLFAYLLFLRKHRPHFGHFNVMQKFEYWAVFWGIPVMGLSGLVLWGAASVSEYASGRALNFAFIVHSDEAYLAFTYIAVVHIFSIILTPAVFPVSPGTLTGQVPPEELVEGHLGEVEALAVTHGIVLDAEGPRRPWIVRLARSFARRVYSAGLLVACAVIGFVSISFLMHLLFSRQTAPVEIREIPKTLDARVLLASQTHEAGSGRDEVPPRGPLAHFHQIPNWFNPDSGNNCTTSGCHEPVPHGKRIEVRAFLNMHATFVDCTVCHAEEAAKGGTPQWFSLPGREPRGTPAVLQLAGMLENPDELARDPRGVADRLVPLLGRAVDESGGSRQLRGWLLRLQTAYPQSEPWNKVLSDMANERTGIRAHVHGEYSAKIGLFADGRLLGSPTPAQSDALRELKAGKPGKPIKAIIDTLHKGIAPKGALCVPCHSQGTGLVDFKALGYPPARVKSLHDSAVVRQILSIEQGMPFYLPNIQE